MICRRKINVFQWNLDAQFDIDSNVFTDFVAVHFMLRQVFKLLLGSSYNTHNCCTMNQETNTAAVNNDKTWDIKFYVHLQCSILNAYICLLSSFITFSIWKNFSFIEKWIEFNFHKRWPQICTCLFLIFLYRMTRMKNNLKC